MKPRFYSSLIGLFVTPFFYAAEAPTVTHIMLLPEQDLVNGLEVGDQPIFGKDLPGVNYIVQPVILAKSFHYKVICSFPKFYSEDHLSARDALFQKCSIQQGAELTGSYQLRELERNQLVHHASITGNSKTTQSLIRMSGDIDIIPPEMYQEASPTFTTISKDQSLKLAYHHFRLQMRQNITDHFAKRGHYAMIHEPQSGRFRTD